MKNKSIISIVLSLLLVCLLSVAAFADTDTGRSTAKITFTEGDLEFADKAELDDSMQNMNIDFEERDIPVVDTTFVAEDGDHTLRVLDPREDAGGWYVNVSMGKFTEDGGSTEFNGTLKLADAALSSTNNGTSWGTKNSAIELYSDNVDVDVVNANKPLTRDAFDLTWIEGSISLDVTAVEAAAILVDETYTATLTWTLSDA